jgi:hypothetical protein
VKHIEAESKDVIVEADAISARAMKKPQMMVSSRFVSKLMAK